MAPCSLEQAITPTQVSIELPLFEQFYELVVAIAQQHSDQPLSTTDKNWVDVLNGCILCPSHQFQNGGYWCTPLNTLSFANTGTDGEHFSFLVPHFRITPRTPVIYTAPMHEPGKNNVIIAPNFKMFLRLGIRHGFFNLGHLLETPNHTLQKLSVTSSPQEEQRVLGAIATQLRLTPHHCSIDEFIALQLRYLPCLQMSRDYLDDSGH